MSFHLIERITVMIDPDGVHRSKCIKCGTIFLINTEWANGNNRLISFDIESNAIYNFKYTRCILSDGDYKMRELLK